MVCHAGKPSLAPLVAIALIAALYVTSYFMMVTVEHSGITGFAQARYPRFIEPVAMLFRPMEFIDSRIRADLWAPVSAGYDYEAVEWIDRGY